MNLPFIIYMWCDDYFQWQYTCTQEFTNHVYMYQEFTNQVWVQIDRGNFTYVVREVTPYRCHVSIPSSKQERGPSHPILSLKPNKKQGPSHLFNQTENEIVLFHPVPEITAGTVPVHLNSQPNATFGSATCMHAYLLIIVYFDLDRYLQLSLACRSIAQLCQSSN